MHYPTGCPIFFRTLVGFLRFGELPRLVTLATYCPGRLNPLKLSHLMSLVRFWSKQFHIFLLQVWDLRRTYSMYRGDPVPRDRFSHPGDSARTGFTSLRISQGGVAYAGCMDNK